MDLVQLHWWPLTLGGISAYWCHSKLFGAHLKGLSHRLMHSAWRSNNRSCSLSSPVYTMSVYPILCLHGRGMLLTIEHLCPFMSICSYVGWLGAFTQGSVQLNERWYPIICPCKCALKYNVWEWGGKKPCITRREASMAEYIAACLSRILLLQVSCSSWAVPSWLYPFKAHVCVLAFVYNGSHNALLVIILGSADVCII